MNTRIRIASTSVAICLCSALLFGAALRRSNLRSEGFSSQPAASGSDHKSLPDADLVRRGKLLFDQTPRYAHDYAGNKLACGDCHIRSGTASYAAPLTNVADLFPMFSKRAGREITLKDRINECFVRSETGYPLPPESPEMQALVAYIQSLSCNPQDGVPCPKRGLVKLPELKGDAARGKEIYVKAQCDFCHGQDGAGIPPVMPPLWGRNSFNDGAGMNNPSKMAAYVFHNMPQNNPGSLTPQEAFDVATYIHSMPRPKFNPIYKSY